MTRKQSLACLKAAGAENDRKTWMRVYVENRISFTVANQMWRDGVAWAKFIAYRNERVDALLGETVVTPETSHNYARDRLRGAQGDT